MRTVLQITATGIPNMGDTELWFDLMDIPPTVNNLAEFAAVATKDMPGRNVRIVQIMEEPDANLPAKV